jgi:hypothetical protein
VIPKNFIRPNLLRRYIAIKNPMSALCINAKEAKRACLIALSGAHPGPLLSEHHFYCILGQVPKRR